MKKKLLPLLILVFAVVVGVWLFMDTPDPIQDTNGPDDFSLTTITDENIIRQDMGARNPVAVRNLSFDFGGITISNGVHFSSESFTGVYEIMYGNFLLNSDVTITLYDFTVESGNFKMCVVYDDEIVAVLEPGELVEYRLEDVNGTVALRIAGESASYNFMMSETDYDLFNHD